MKHSRDCMTGTITSVNTFFAYFEIDSSIKVHMSILITHGKIEKLPKPGSRISFKNAHKFGSSYVICKSSIIEGNFLIDCPFNSYLNLIKLHKLGSIDIIKFEEFANTIQKNFTCFDEETKIDTLVSLFHNIILLKMEEGSIILGQERCMNCIISSASVTTVNMSKHVEIKSDEYNNFPYWSFGVFPVRNNMLFGYLEIQPLYGFYMIKDSYYQMVCVIFGNNEKPDFEMSLQNSYVLLEKYIVITEIFKEREIPNIEYILVNADDIHIIPSMKNNQILFGSKSVDLQYIYATSFVLLKKSTSCMGCNNSPQLLLHVFLRIKSNKLFWKEAYLVLPSFYVYLNLYLKEGCLYGMYYNNPLKEVTNRELERIKSLKTFEVQDRACHFELIHVGMYNKPRIYNVLECKFNVKSCTELISFQGIITNKSFANALSSRTVQNSSIYGFGTPGQKVHQIIFSQIDNQETIFLDCYLNNWENMLMPLGLVPQMEVIVRHVMPQSRKYLKSTIFTTFEVVSYKPLLSFTTVNLYKNFKDDWGIPFHLSQGHKIPVGVLVWGKVFSIFILKVTLTFQCTSVPDTNSHSDALKEIDLRFNVLDQYGQSVVTTRSVDVLRVFMNLRQSDFTDWITTFQHTGIYNYNYFDESNPVDDDLTVYLKKINERKFYLDLKCWKLKTTSSQASEKPLWDCIEARRS